MTVKIEVVVGVVVCPHEQLTRVNVAIVVTNPKKSVFFVFGSSFSGEKYYISEYLISTAPWGN